MYKRKLVFITSNLTQTGGLQMITACLANEFSKLDKYSVEIINLGLKDGDEKYKLNSNIKINYVGVSNSNCRNKFELIVNTIKRYIRLKKYIRLNSINKNQIVIGMGLGSSYLLPYIYNRKNNILIGTQHSPVRHTKLMDIFRKITIEKMNHYVVLDKDTKINMETNCKLKDIKVIPNALTINVDSRSDINSKTVLAIGRLSKEKGFDVLLDVWKLVTSKYNDWNLIIVGEGKEYESLNNKIKSMEIEKSVSIKPFTKEIEKYYKNASIFALSSRYEGFGLVALEAQAFGIPVVAFDCPTGPRNIINDGVDGYLVELGNINEFYEKVSNLIENKELRIKIGNNAIKNSKKFSVKNIISEWKALIEIN